MSRPYICYCTSCEYNIDNDCFIGGCQYRVKTKEETHQDEDKGEKLCQRINL